MGQIPCLSATILSALEAALRVDGDRETEQLSGAVQQLSRLFTRQRERLGSGYLDDDGMRKGYLAYFLPVNVGKVRAILEELPPRRSGEAGASGTFRLLDLGCGPGSASLAALDWLFTASTATSKGADVMLVDRSRGAISDATRLLNGYAASVPEARVAITSVHADLERGGWAKRLSAEDAAPFDLIILANALNELYVQDRNPVQRRVRLVTRLTRCLREDGSLIVIEPATRAESRALLEVRDAILAERLCTIYSPCLHDGPCQALVKEEDWCHEERPWQAPPLVRAIDRRVGLIKDALKFSYLVLRKDGRTIVPRDEVVFRVVSELRRLKGERRAWLCNSVGRFEVGRLDKVRSDSNGAVDAWHRGAIVKIDEITRTAKTGREGGVGRIQQDGSVQIIRSV